MHGTGLRRSPPPPEPARCAHMRLLHGVGQVLLTGLLPQPDASLWGAGSSLLAILVSMLSFIRVLGPPRQRRRFPLGREGHVLGPGGEPSRAVPFPGTLGPVPAYRGVFFGEGLEWSPVDGLLSPWLGNRTARPAFGAPGSCLMVPAGPGPLGAHACGHWSWASPRFGCRCTPAPPRPSKARSRLSLGRLPSPSWRLPTLAQSGRGEDVGGAASVLAAAAWRESTPRLPPVLPPPPGRVGGAARPRGASHAITQAAPCRPWPPA